ncbi:hypothetical protein [Streptococcus uberis]|uniref:hypothetical protein n=1 Tax=Streptococcus uberis TaxID=1349 RepID=UPI003BAA1E37
MKKLSKEILIKTIKTMAQTGLGLLGTSALISDVNWQVWMSGVLMAGFACILMNISQIKE